MDEDIPNVIGESEDAARKMIEAAGYTMRVVRVNNEFIPVIMNLDVKRFNVGINKFGIVDETFSVG